LRAIPAAATPRPALHSSSRGSWPVKSRSVTPSAVMPIPASTGWRACSPRPRWPGPRRPW